MANPAHIRQQALELPERERAELARELLHSLDDAADDDGSVQWAEVIERRGREVLEGTAELVDGNEAVARVRARLLDRHE